MAQIAVKRTGSFSRRPQSAKAVLDVGCHSGFYCFMAASEGAKDCLGVDIDEKHLSRAKRVLKRYNIPNVHFINEDALECKFPRAFDVVLCLNLLQHLGTLDRVDALLKALLHAATGEAVLIFPTTRTRDQLYANENIDGKPYLLLSVKYLVRKILSDSDVACANACAYIRAESGTGKDCERNPSLRLQRRGGNRIRCDHLDCSPARTGTI